MKRLTATLLILLMVVTIMPSSLGYVEASGESFEDAISFELNETVYNSGPEITEKEQAIYYTFETNKAGWYTIIATECAVSASCRIFLLSSHMELLNSWSLSGGVISDQLNLDSNTKYYLKVVVDGFYEIDDYEWKQYVRCGFAFKISDRWLDTVELDNRITIDSMGEDGFFMITASPIRCNETVVVNNPYDPEEQPLEYFLAFEQWFKIKASSNPGSVYLISSNIDRVWVFKGGDYWLSKYEGGLRVAQDTYLYIKVKLPYNYYVNSENENVQFTVTEIVDKTKPKTPIMYTRSWKTGAITLTWGYDDNVSKYQIAYKEKNARKWSYITVGYDQNSKVITGLKRWTNYTVMIRAIKVVNDENIYGDWCKRNVRIY